MRQIDIQIRQGWEEDFAHILPLCDERYGRGYINRQGFDHWMEHPSLLKVAESEGAFAGFAVMVPASYLEISKKMGMPAQDVERIAGGRPALIYKSAAVPLRFERCGIMHAMAQAGLDTARAEGYGSLFGSAWIYNGKIPISGTFKTFDFRPLYKRQMLWYDDPEYHCVLCKGRCRCEAMIYYKTL